MRMRGPFILICSLLLSAMVFADNEAPAPDGLQLLYAPRANSSISQKLKAELLDVTLSGESSYMTGTASAEVHLKFSEPPPGNSGTVMTVTVSKMQGQTMGEQLAVSGPQVVDLHINERGRVVGYQIKKRVSDADISAMASADALTILAIVAALPLLPEEAVVPDSQWHWQQVITLRDVGQATVDMQCHLIDSPDGQIVIESSGKITMPEVQVPNPFDPSGVMKATNLKVTISRLRQICQPGTLVVSQVQCEAMATFIGIQADYTVPLGMKFKFSVRPSPPPAPE